jgi:hypothetical protein
MTKKLAQRKYYLKTFVWFMGAFPEIIKLILLVLDFFESIIKTHTVIILAEYVKHNKLSETAKGLLVHSLKTPSIGY